MNSAPSPRPSDDLSRLQRLPKTVLESVEEAREIVRQSREAPPSVPPGLTKLATTIPHPQGSKGPENLDDDDHQTTPYRPGQRPPMALLTVFDDGGKEGEVVRIRKETFTIGRETADLVIPHDNQISRSHLEISRRWDSRKERYRWFLRDLGSSNGTFVKVATSPLSDRQEILLGNTRFRFEGPSPGASPAPISPTAALPGTVKWNRETPPGTIGGSLAAIVEMLPDSKERRVSLVQGEYSIGRSANLAAIVVYDPMISPRHARLFRDPQGIWNIENAKSLNGLWLRVSEIAIDRGGQFQCGEQQFLIRIP